MRLLPFAVLALIDFMMFAGHEIPKLTIISASKNSTVVFPFFRSGV
jgi:hypothetical protein